MMKPDKIGHQASSISPGQKNFSSVTPSISITNGTVKKTPQNKTMKPEKWVFKLLLFLSFGSCIALDTITPSRPLKDGELLISDGKNYVLGFFSPGKSSFRYVGIWYYKVSEQTVVWVANRDRPINGSAGVLLIGEDGNLAVQESNQSSPLWRTNVSAIAGSTSSAARLLDSGNLILFGGEKASVVTWQSFDHPTDTFLPEMKLGLDRRTGLNRILTSWKSGDDPATGVYSLRVEQVGLAHPALYRGSTPLWRSVPWIVYGNFDLKYVFRVNLTFVDNDKEVSLVYSSINSSIVSRIIVDTSGHHAMFTWDEGKSEWVRLYRKPDAACDEYGHCGANGLCFPDDGHNFECSCLPGYEPKSPAEWYKRDVSGGCAKKRVELSMCRNREGFLKVSNTKIPDTSVAQVQTGLSLAECEGECLGNCSCTAYAVENRGVFGLGDCIMWFGNLVDVIMYQDLGLEFYVRVDAVELAQQKKRKTQSSREKKVGILVVSVVAISLSIVFAVVWFVIKRKKEVGLNILQTSEEERNLELPIFDLATIVRATNNFARENKIGEGGFGPVYKGYLSTEREIAVKRLSINSKQGVDEFKNEIILIAKLQHRNLVRLLGCCIHREERMLVYEYMPNGSLDSFIFGVENKKHKLLTWRGRLDIILGIARGLLYLHQDSRLRVIHRDLKTSNILLDSEMNPKISDFGIAKVVRGDQSSAITRRVVGTYGYMSPEYVIDGVFSTKLDVFSFGVIILEILTGQRNRMFRHPEQDLNLLGHAWKLWAEGKALELLNPLVDGSTPILELLRCIQIGLLCVQKCPEDRPNMSIVLLMLTTETAKLPQPKQPGFYSERKNNENDHDQISKRNFSINEMTTQLEAR